ncbi:MAG: YciI family protein, partial [Allorhizobium sp.]
MLFAVICADKPGHLNLRMETRPPHVEWLNGLNAAGQLKIAGPFLDAE